MIAYFKTSHQYCAKFHTAFGLDDSVIELTFCASETTKTSANWQFT